ncbi:prepilin-type N-terminal cleavage/methylation domain-containing protein [Pseudomonas entomophila]|jgi:type IV pilus assembly protein PilE|uniref:type IV pilin protein n=1 Tax=Pseudomonas entomophila TaxID=312306 RepID=UPI0015E2C069|nr:type IV pilin protein [Pseudomonas entomophila]MBA1193909.1 prepilin-type N-terminal cleavage/methylation domain-containing protein [Pseudomonas entomophila]
MQRGISLIELLIVLAVTGMLAAVALPAYDEPLKRAARAEVVGLLHDVALRLEQHRVRHGRYDEPPPGTPWPAGTRHYRLIVRHDATTYRLTAERIPDGRLAQDPCGDFQLDQAGRRDNLGGHVPAEACWGS